MLQAVDQALHTVAPAVNDFVKGSSLGLVALSWNSVVDAFTTEIGSDSVERVSLIPYNSAWQAPGSTSARPLDGSLFHQLLEHRCFVLLAWSKHKADRLTFTFTPHMYLGTEPAPAPA